MDPRVERTREHVLACARTLLAERGAEGVTFSSVGKAARVARQTLYRHWSTREQLIADVLVTTSDVGRPAVAGSTPETHLRTFLLGLRDRMTSPAIESATALLIAHATNDEGSATTLQNMTDDRINLLRTGWGPVDEDEYALIVGPLVMQILVLRRPLSDGFIDVIVAEAMGRRRHRLPPEGRSVSPEGRSVSPEGRSVSTEGRSVSPDASVVPPQGAIPAGERPEPASS